MSAQARILLTGAGGFLGREVARALSAHHVIGVARHPAANAAVAEWIQADLLHCDMQTVAEEARADTLIHLAWTTEHGKFWTAKDNLDWAAATLRLLRSFDAAGGKRAVLAGSCAEYDLSATVDAYCERRDLPSPHTLYGTAKDATRRMAEAYCRESGLSFAWARIFFLFGPHEHPNRLGGSIAKALVLDEEARCSSGIHLRDFLSTADAGGAIAALALSGVGGAVNIGSGTAMSIGDFARAFGDAAGRPDLIRLGAMPDRPGDPARIVADITRLRDEVGFRASVTFEQRVRETLDWWRTAEASG
ncbi:NAD(P)-dependent oxidoreductase [Breoghania sp. L-A4]|uniref:NAD-dependent epimerase/dehydratase family protein n=1 Tax=Breoghania sp. L-A4 TaxID=2304600 RepID=UPI0013C2B1EE|nr:NAD(P)-dependent oxidoreductase [Breoghania sp. L-A4]